MSEPAWLVALIDQRLALVEDKLGEVPAVTHMVMTPLTEPREDATQREYDEWDRTCDSCRKFQPNGKNFYTGHIVRQLKSGLMVYMTFGVCESCKW